MSPAMREMAGRAGKENSTRGLRRSTFNFDNDAKQVRQGLFNWVTNEVLEFPA